MSEQIFLRRPDAEVGDRREYNLSVEPEPFDLYGRSHEARDVEAMVAVTRLTDGVHLDVEVTATVETSCDRTLEPVDLPLRFGDSEFLPGPEEPEMSVSDWTLDLTRYVQRALPTEIPMQVFAPGTEPVRQDKGEGEMDPRWRGLDDLFASGF
jgi:uncharacterized protein